MVIPLVLALMPYPPPHAAARIGANQEYEEPAYIQQIPGYHPFLRFLPGSTFVFLTPYKTVADGHYALNGNHYEFRPETVEMLNHSDADRLLATMPPEDARDASHKYSLSLTPFNADYNSSGGELYLNYNAQGIPGKFTLYDYIAGDANLINLVLDIEKPLVALWGQTDPNPEKLDSKTRFRIGGVEGLAQFAHEASASDNAEFNLIDLRTDNTFRIHSIQGRWKREGAIAHLTAPGMDLKLQIGRDLSKLFTGKTVYKR